MFLSVGVNASNVSDPLENWGTGNGTFGEKWGKFSGSDGDFFSPQGIACGDNGEVYTVDTLLNRVIKFVP
ncbi:hypothetical protein [Clostridium sediminicola]|uniref:hypothetical protein n=1 Tax=Clostridium sediminicola TaxID=3114879 RepID=UPI003D162B03